MDADTLQGPGDLASSPLEDRIGAGEAIQNPVAPAVLDVGNYADPAQLQRELSSLFPRCWVPACPIADVAAPRDFTVWERIGESVVIVRGDDGALTAFYNVCQHRGAKLASGSGRCSTGSFKCPWHGFSYDLRGVVDHVPLRESFAAEQVDGLRAPPVRVHEWAGFVWLALSDAAPDFDSYLGDLKPEIDAYDFDRLQARHFHSWEIAANWKMVVDAFNEFWHVPFAHKNSLQGGLLWRDAALQLIKPHTLSALPIRGVYEQALQDDDYRRGIVCHCSVFPSTLYNCFPSHAQVLTSWPIDTQHTILVGWGLTTPAPQDADDEWRARDSGEWDQFCRVIDEDVEILNELGQVQGSRGYRRNIFNSAEGRLTSFHETVAEMTGATPPRMLA
ncbi:MAG: aromatic ring-hydroxylating oxygenase subunit alpha [Solirubrobacteraceae bacterium]